MVERGSRENNSLDFYTALWSLLSFWSYRGLSHRVRSRRYRWRTLRGPRNSSVSSTFLSLCVWPIPNCSWPIQKIIIIYEHVDDEISWKFEKRKLTVSGDGGDCARSPSSGYASTGGGGGFSLGGSRALTGVNSSTWKHDTDQNSQAFVLSTFWTRRLRERGEKRRAFH